MSTETVNMPPEKPAFREMIDKRPIIGELALIGIHLVDTVIQSTVHLFVKTESARQPIGRRLGVNDLTK